jgi:hypothetical protein
VNAWDDNMKKLRDNADKLEAAAKNLVKFVGKNNPRKVMLATYNSRGVLIVTGDGESITIEPKGRI